ncbi:7-cyano-7-deazaguanine synthase [Pseudomonas viridiflava]|uniref:7-cyano-7-deazaguanine synthase n=1 Tax=Pseudomonas viridiflava TaxID=33069 RepID=UPI001785C2DD|nr:7-cyano-7-deazaguanine synthase [Pseudomonas viridiflava]MBD8204780.1 7-cyano-7-deazaguanine synthase [Pseudomonas viridiflava]MEE4333859.1 7-cyano-7-deazaguanine synthase [Pseudomonas alliivorans]MEE4342905.1 7-cyano-7-deazaguanine synthase [Pseudomonas alliivorans]MEE5127471.1 7-cyano-7-deazaguanine synthase [Pseudomonas alliivorans]
MKTALLLSGGMDSLSIAWWKRPAVAITLNYGQLAAEAEIAASRTICKQLGIDHHIITIDCRPLGSGDMAGNVADQLAPASDWWPYRNQLLITMAAMKAISLGVSRLWLGTVKSDVVHRDGSPEFIDVISELLSLQEGGLVVEAPAIELSTAELVRASGIPPGSLAWAHSCHKSNVPCGNCRGCNKYFHVFDEVGHDLDRSR